MELPDWGDDDDLEALRAEAAANDAASTDSSSDDDVTNKPLSASKGSDVGDNTGDSSIDGGSSQGKTPTPDYSDFSLSPDDDDDDDLDGDGGSDKSDEGKRAKAADIHMDDMDKDDNDGGPDDDDDDGDASDDEDPEQAAYMRRRMAELAEQSDSDGSSDYEPLSAEATAARTHALEDVGGAGDSDGNKEKESRDKNEKKDEEEDKEEESYSDDLEVEQDEDVDADSDPEQAAYLRLRLAELADADSLDSRDSGYDYEPTPAPARRDSQSDDADARVGVSVDTEGFSGKVVRGGDGGKKDGHGSGLRQPSTTATTQNEEEKKKEKKETHTPIPPVSPIDPAYMARRRAIQEALSKVQYLGLAQRRNELRQREEQQLSIARLLRDKQREQYAAELARRRSAEQGALFWSRRADEVRQRDLRIRALQRRQLAVLRGRASMPTSTGVRASSEDMFNKENEFFKGQNTAVEAGTKKMTTTTTTTTTTTMGDEEVDDWLVAGGGWGVNPLTNVNAAAVSGPHQHGTDVSIATTIGVGYGMGVEADFDAESGTASVSDPGIDGDLVREHELAEEDAQRAANEREAAVLRASRREHTREQVRLLLDRLAAARLAAREKACEQATIMAERRALREMLAYARRDASHGFGEDGGANDAGFSAYESLCFASLQPALTTTQTVMSGVGSISATRATIHIPKGLVSSSSSSVSSSSCSSVQTTPLSLSDDECFLLVLAVLQNELTNKEEEGKKAQQTPADASQLCLSAPRPSRDELDIDLVLDVGDRQLGFIGASGDADEGRADGDDADGDSSLSSIEPLYSDIFRF